MADAALRLFEVFQLIPLYPRKITSKELLSRLESSGYSVDIRTVQRDIAKLKDANFGIGQTRPTGRGKENLSYYFEKNAHTLGPGMDAATALFVLMAGESVGKMLPDKVIAALQPAFNQAEINLAQAAKGGKFAAWQSKVRSVPRYLAFLKPEIDEHIHEVVTEALLEEKCLFLKHWDDKEFRTIHPLALIDRGLETILHAWDESRNAYRQFLLHRMKEVKASTFAVRVPDDHDLDALIAEGYFSVPIKNSSSSPIQLQLRLWQREDGALPWLDLEGTPLSSDQQIIINAESEMTAELTASVNDTWELRGWLLSLGEQVEVLGPPALRDFMKQSVATLVKRY